MALLALLATWRSAVRQPICENSVKRVDALVYYSTYTLVHASSLFRVEPSSGVPIYRQLMDQVISLRASGRLAPEAFLPSVRQVAEELAVNPMTVSKAWSLLERDGVVELARGQGMRVTRPRTTASHDQRLDELRPLLAQVAARAHQLALPRRSVLETLAELLPQDQSRKDPSQKNQPSQEKP